MKREINRVTDIKLAYIGGGSKLWAWKFIADLAVEEQMSGTVRLYDIDEQAAKYNEIIGNQWKNRPECRGKWDYEVKHTLEEALDGADFVIISILPGTMEEMRSDVHTPERLGIWQPVGDTAGPGGMIRALRTLPMYRVIGEAIKNCCPDAWVINYTNPMSLCVKSLYDTFPEIHAFGCCHEVFGTQELLAGIAAQTLGVEKIDRREIHVNVLGINHFTWFDEATYHGIDLFPIYRNYIEEHYEEGFSNPEHPWDESPFGCAHRVKMDLFRHYGYMAAAGDRHLVEFLPGNRYLKDPETVKSWRFSLTTVDYRVREYEERAAQRDRMINGTEKMELSPSGEEGVQLMKALTGLTRMISNVNLPNRDLQISNLPADAVVETNAVFSGGSIRPIMAGSVPEELRMLMMPHIENHERILTASKTYSHELVAEAFMNDPLVQAKCTDPSDIRALADDMIRNTKKYLPKEW